MFWLQEAVDALGLDRDRKEETLAPIYQRVELALHTYWTRSVTLLLQMLTPTAWAALNVLPLEEGPGWNAWMAAGGLAGSGMTHPEFVADYMLKLEALEATNKLEGILVKEAGAALEAGYESVGTYGILSSFKVSHPEAIAHAAQEAGEKIAGINQTSMNQVKTVIANGISEGKSYQVVAKDLIKLHQEWAIPSPLGHIRSRAELIAVTEMGNAYVQGTVLAGQELQAAGLVMEKHWLTVGDMRVDKAQCANNDAAGWIPFDTDFPSGHPSPLAHPGCRCDLQVRKAASQGPEKLKAKLKQEPSSITPAKAPQAAPAPPPAPKPPAPPPAPSAPFTAQNYAKELLKAGEGNTSVAKKVSAAFPDEHWTADKVSGLKRRLGLTPEKGAPRAAATKPGQPIKLGKVNPKFDGMLNRKATQHLHPSEAARQGAKKDLTRDIATRLKGNPTWDDFAKKKHPWAIDADNDAVRHLIGKWADTSADRDPISLAMQMSAHEEFGLTATARRAIWDGLGPSMRRMVEQELTAHGDAYRVFLRAMYDNTQEVFAREGITHVSLYRGQALTDAFTPQWAIDSFGHVVQLGPGGKVSRVTGQAAAELHAELRPLSSFSADPQIARRFSTMLAEGQIKGTVIMEGTIPVENIIGTARTGYGCLTEYEFVLLDSPGEFTLTLKPY